MTCVPQLVVHVFVFKMCSEQIYGVILGSSSPEHHAWLLSSKKQRERFAAQMTRVPICAHFSASLLFPRPTVDGDDLRPSSFNHLRILERRLQIVVHTNLCRHGYRKRLVELANQRFHSLPIIHQKRPVITPLRDPLRTPKVNINPIAIRRNHRRRLQQNVGIVGAKLRQQRTIRRRRAEYFPPVLGRLHEQPRVNHWRVPQRRPVSSAQLSKRQFALIHHWRDVIPRRTHRLEKRKPSELRVRSRGFPPTRVLALLVLWFHGKLKLPRHRRVVRCHR